MLNRIFEEAAVKIKMKHVFIKLRKLRTTSMIKNNQKMFTLLSSIEKHTKASKKEIRKSQI